MLHLRVIAPEDLRDTILDVLRGEVGVANIVLHPGAALEPVGDEITADIARECANDVIKELKALDVQHGARSRSKCSTPCCPRGRTGPRTRPKATRGRRHLGRADRTHPRGVHADVTFVMFLTLACLLAAVGVVTDSTVTVVGRDGARSRVRPAGRARGGAGAAPLDLARRAALALLDRLSASRWWSPRWPPCCSRRSAG